MVVPKPFCFSVHLGVLVAWLSLETVIFFGVASHLCIIVVGSAGEFSTKISRVPQV